MEDKTPYNSCNNSICEWCGQITQIIWVHGHGQCSNCGYNIDECCRGESGENEFLSEKEKEENS